MDSFGKLRKEFSFLALDKIREGESPHEVFMALQAGSARIAQPGLNKKEYMDGAAIAFDCAQAEYEAFKERQKTEN